MWSEKCAKNKQLYEQETAKLRERLEEDIAANHAKGKGQTRKKGPGRLTGSKRRSESEDEEEEEEEDSKDKEEECEAEEYTAVPKCVESV